MDNEKLSINKLFSNLTSSDVSLVTKIAHNHPDGLLTDRDIKSLCVGVGHPMISDWIPRTKMLLNRRIPSLGQSICGYDIACAPEWKIFKEAKDNQGNLIVCDIMDDTININQFVEVAKGPYVDIPPGTTLLAKSTSYFRMPTDVMGLALGKSTWARVGLDVMVTPLEPGWEGELVIEISNNQKNPVRFHSGVGCLQIVFFRTKNKPDATYASEKYQGQRGITMSKV